MQLWLGLSYLDYGAPCLFLACFFVSFCLSVGFFWPGRTGTGLGPDWDWSRLRFELNLKSELVRCGVDLKGEGGGEGGWQ